MSDLLPCSLWTLLIFVCLSACSEAPPAARDPAAVEAPQNKTSIEASGKTAGIDDSGRPPGFTDPPPPAPTSATQILSGGTLMTSPEITDAVIVIRHGQVIAWGKRGEVEVPNDSIGVDLRGMWLQPNAQLALNQPADFQVFAQAPADNPAARSVGYIQADKINLPDPDLK